MADTDLTDPSGMPVLPISGQQINPNYATPEQLLQLRALANTQITQHEPAKSWAGVLGGMAQTLAGYQNLNRAQQQQNATFGGAIQDTQAHFGALGNAYGGGGGGGGGGLLGSDPISAMGAAIAQRETGGTRNPYTVDGPRSKSGDYPSGKYQVMGANIPSWTQEALGQPLTREQFKANPQAQEAVFRSRMGGYLQEHSPQDAASMWISGKPLAQALAAGNKPDVLGTTPAAYSSAVVAALRGGGGGQGAGMPAGGGTQVAQNAGPGGYAGPAARALINPMTPENVRTSILGTITPQQTTDWAGGKNVNIPLQGPGTRPQLPGAAAAPMTAGNVGITQYQPVVGGQLSPNAAGGGPGSPGTQNTVRDMTNLGNISKEAENDANVVNAAKTGLGEARQHLADVESFRALGKDVDSGAIPQTQGLLASFGFQWGGSDVNGRIQAYRAMAQQLLGENDKFADRIGGLSTTPEGRDIIANYLANKFKNAVAVGEIANSGKGNTSQRAQQIYSYQRTPYYTSQGTVTAGGGAGGKGAGSAGTSSAAAAGAAPQYKEGQTAISKDGKSRQIFKSGKWQPL